jgi:DNA-binding NtrC family response regulator
MRQDGWSPTILIVDDDRELCVVLVTVLADAGYGTRCAYDGEAAWAEIRAHPPRLVLSDIAMPHLDGLGLARRMVAAASGIPVILMSAGAGNGASAVGAAFLPKPFDLDRLVALVADLIGPAHATGLA